jgi:hypothetical protein
VPGGVCKVCRVPTHRCESLSFESTRRLKNSMCNVAETQMVNITSHKLSTVNVHDIPIIK